MQDQVFVIRTTKYLEYDLIARTLSADYGKTSYIVRGGQRSKKRFGGGTLETGNLILIEFKPSRIEEKLGTLNEAKVIYGFEDIRTDYDKIEMAFYFFKLIDKIEWSENEYSRIFSLVKNTLSQLEVTEDLQVLKFLFDIKILYLQGVLPINEITKKWLKLHMNQCDEMDSKSRDFLQYIKFNQHLMKELCP